MDPAELERLVDEEKIDELFAIVSLEDVWLDPDLDPFFDRIERAAGVALKRPLPWPEGFERPSGADGA
jgi:hypothetical protein